MFGFVKNSMHGFIVRAIGIDRKMQNRMMNLIYNVGCCTQLKIVVAIVWVCPNVKDEVIHSIDIQSYNK